MGGKANPVAEAFHHLPHHRIVALGHIEGQATRFGAGQAGVFGQVLADGVKVGVTQADKLAAQAHHWVKPPAP